MIPSSIEELKLYGSFLMKNVLDDSNKISLEQKTKIIIPDTYFINVPKKIDNTHDYEC